MILYFESKNVLACFEFVFYRSLGGHLEVVIEFQRKPQLTIDNMTLYGNICFSLNASDNKNILVCE